ncbi:MAG: FkbM family methyltransferase [Bacteroidota bacterium]|nr:FkbM family methyltransferase [Bacteroidota bacterium]
MWDIGASYGIYTIFSSLKVNKGNVFAFEPEKSTHKLLANNIQLNNLRNVTPLQMAIGESEGIVELHTSESANIGTHSLAVRTDYPVSGRGQKIQIQKGDELVKHGTILSPTAIKIDVEGAELNVLRGIETILSSPLTRIVQIEIHPNILPLFGETQENIFMLMELNNFAVIKSIQRGTELEVLFEKPMLAKS